MPGKQRAWTRPVPAGAVRAAAGAAGSTVNDLMLTAITAALRRYLLEHDAPADEVIVIVPVNLRPAGAPLPAGLGNQFGLAFVRLPTGETDQGRRRARVKAQMDQVKNSHEGVFVYTMLQWMGQLPAAVQNAWVDAFAGQATAIVTNVSGPPHRIQITGTPVAGMAGWVPVTGPLGLGLSIISYAGQLRSAWPATRTWCPATTGSWPCSMRKSAPCTPRRHHPAAQSQEADIPGAEMPR